MSGLTDKQELFVNAYLECWNATEAARRAGYAGSDVTLASVGWENLRKPQIERRIKERLQSKAMSADEALMRMAEIARAEYSQYIEPDASVNVEMMIADGKAHLIKGITPTSYGLKIEFHDAQSALNTVLKAQGVFVDKVEHSGEIQIKGYAIVSPDDWDEDDD